MYIVYLCQHVLSKWDQKWRKESWEIRTRSRGVCSGVIKSSIFCPGRSRGDWGMLLQRGCWLASQPTHTLISTQRKKGWGNWDRGMVRRMIGGLKQGSPNDRHGRVHTPEDTPECTETLMKFWHFMLLLLFLLWDYLAVVSLYSQP